MKKDLHKDPAVFLEHILDAINDIFSYIEGANRKDFFADKKTQDAVMRKIEIIGEAASNIPTELRDASPHIPWRNIVAMRNMLIHEYFNVDLGYAWGVAKIELPKLKRQIEKILKEIVQNQQI